VYHFEPMRFVIVSSLKDSHLLACSVGPSSHADRHGAWADCSCYLSVVTIKRAQAYTAYVVLMSLASVLVVNNVCPESVGGGIPETKTVLSGLIWKPILSVRLIWAKMVGLVFALVAGLSVGKEVRRPQCTARTGSHTRKQHNQNFLSGASVSGMSVGCLNRVAIVAYPQGPFVHVAVAVAESLMQLQCFRHCRRNVSKRLDVLGCASAAGVAATFGTPFGGVLFSIEVTAHYYLVRVCVPILVDH
jgi:chloride channel 2